MEQRPVVDPFESEPGSADFDAVFVASYPRLVRTLTVVCGDGEVAADCVADAFERAFVRWHRVARLDDPVGWVRRVAINRARDINRRNVRGRRAVERLAHRVETVVPASPEFLDGRLLKSVRELPLQQRTAVALHYLEDMSVADIALAMRLNEGTVKYHLHQARGRLRSTWATDTGDAP